MFTFLLVAFPGLTIGGPGAIGGRIQGETAAISLSVKKRSLIAWSRRHCSCR